MKKLMILMTLMWCFGTVLSAQNLFDQAKAQVEEQSDPEAVVIMKKVKAKYEAFSTMEVEFKLKMEGEVEDEFKGKVYIEGDKYNLGMESQDIICDGETIWFHLKDNNEVQINNNDPEQVELTPAGMVKIYEQDMIYIMVGEAKENDRLVHKLEFKPKDRDSEYSKLRVSIDKKTNEVSKIIAFGKDATRYILNFENITTNHTLPEDIFTFDASKYPNIHIEELRIDD